VTPVEFVEALRTMHEPYLPRLVDVKYPDGSSAHPATIDEMAAACEMWCDACRLPARRCLVAHLLVAVEA